MSSPSIATGAISIAASNGPTIAVNQLTVNPGSLTVREMLTCFDQVVISLATSHAQAPAEHVRPAVA